MTIERIRAAHQARPFRPFTLLAGGGREYHIPHPEILAVSPTGRTVFITYGEESLEIIDLLLVESLHFGDGKGGRNGQRGSGRGRKR